MQKSNKYPLMIFDISGIIHDAWNIIKHNFMIQLVLEVLV